MVYPMAPVTAVQLAVNPPAVASVGAPTVGVGSGVRSTTVPFSETLRVVASVLVTVRVPVFVPVVVALRRT